MAASNDYRAYAQHLAKKYKLKYFVPQINQESHFDPNAKSPAGALGIGQIMPETAKGWGVDPMNPRAALEAAARNMAKYRDQYGNEEDALIAYNAGPGRVGKALPAETKKYLEIIMGSPGASNVSSNATMPRGTTGTSMATPTQPSVYDVIRSYRENTTPQPEAPKLGASGFSSPFDPVASGQQIQTTVDRIKAIKGQATAGFQAGDMSAGGLSAADMKNAPAALASMIQEADSIDSARLPYVYGGGHSSENRRGGKLMPLDCSATVSRVLGIDPRVSGDFKKWGQGGRGRNVTIYANDEHVLMEINGHFFGTSRANPNGGAGWIPKSAITPEYLKRFVARHPSGM